MQALDLTGEPLFVRAASLAVQATGGATVSALSPDVGTLFEFSVVPSYEGTVELISGPAGNRVSLQVLPVPDSAVLVCQDQLVAGGTVVCYIRPQAKGASVAALASHLSASVFPVSAGVVSAIFQDHGAELSFAFTAHATFQGTATISVGYDTAVETVVVGTYLSSCFLSGLT